MIKLTKCRRNLRVFYFAIWTRNIRRTGKLPRQFDNLGLCKVWLVTQSEQLPIFQIQYFRPRTTSNFEVSISGTDSSDGVDRKSFLYGFIFRDIRFNGGHERLTSCFRRSNFSICTVEAVYTLCNWFIFCNLIVYLSNCFVVSGRLQRNLPNGEWLCRTTGGLSLR